MRKLVAILLLAVFGLPLALPLLAQGGIEDAGLPACCRRNGAHHCAMSMAQRSQTPAGAPAISAPAERCPYCAQAPATVHPESLTPGTADAIFADLVSHPAVHAQTESRWRIARDRSRQKRGPPASTTLPQRVA